ncbi:uncharacterized protein LOC114336806 isoform X1 [Diabrotica virgifera virgifera]|uniref:Uncharacterized protein n=1 Tax=Diabrotica virgifera virgifera TaxID=50390 RepID=A0ABM5K8L9_DIAVI|nr:uncharacterized protein LOC114336806 isoform X1 [Diabrotica virgifera virgifera]XP_050506530.1 uncharacterized protein LOC114336806 isoform X1 [Diabrotica virgifera virgifera]
MSENSKAQITQLFTSFDSFVKILEDSEWFPTAKIEDIKTAFKLGNYIEKTTHHFKSNDLWNNFSATLISWWKTKNRTKVYCDSVYSFACDELLIRFFRCSNISHNTLDIAVTIYTSLLPKTRFESLLERLILDAGNLEAVTDYLNSTTNDGNAKHLEYQLKLRYWDMLLQLGQESALKEQIKDMLLPYNVETFLYILIGILSLDELSETEKQVQNIILNDIINKMFDRSLLGKQFWLTLFKKIDKTCTYTVCKNFNTFLSNFLNFIIYVGSMMKKVGNFWKSDPNICFYPEIEYADILAHIINLNEIDSIRLTLKDRLKDAKESTKSDIWDQILSDISNK